MKLENQLCSLKLAKRLKELGVKQESLFCWYHPTSMSQGREPTDKEWDDKTWLIGSTLHLYENVGKKGRPRSWFIGCLPAFTTSELGEMLPASIGNKTWLSYTKSFNGWKDICERISYDKWEKDKGAGQMLIKSKVKISNNPYREYEEQTLTEANARAKMLIYLLENKLINLPK